jgi:hypothetical protein
LKAPLIAVLSVGIAAAVPAVAISADTPSGRTGQQARPGAVKVDLHQPLGRVTIGSPTRVEIRHRRLTRKYLKLRVKAARLAAKVHHHRKARGDNAAIQIRWSNHKIGQEVHALERRIKRLRAARRARSGLTAAIRVILQRIAAGESHGNPRAIGGGGAFRGKYQFTYGAWRSVGGGGDPAAAPEAEQDRRAARLLEAQGTSPWPVCG